MHFNLLDFEIIEKSSICSNAASIASHTSVKEEPKRTNRVISGLLTRIRSLDTSHQRKSTSPTVTAKSCTGCQMFENQLVTLIDDLNAVENELRCNKDVIKVLQSQLDQAIAEREAIERLCLSKANNCLLASGNELDSINSTQQLIEAQKQISQLQVQLKEANIQSDKHREENEYLREKQEKLMREKTTLVEMLQVKDQTVISLTNEIFELEKDKNPLQSQVDQIRNAQQLQQHSDSLNEIERLRDSLRAYRVQNEFLNKEIVTLTNLKKRTEQRQQKLELQCYEWEAKCCQIQSKLLSLLKEINYNSDLIEQRRQQAEAGDIVSTTSDKEQTILSNESIRRLVERLLDENSLDIPVSWRPGNKRTDSRGSRANKSSAGTTNEMSVGAYDELGFSIRDPQESDFEHLFGNLNMEPRTSTSSVSSLTVKSIESSAASTSTETKITPEMSAAIQQSTWKSAWNTYIESLRNTDITNRSIELKNLLRSGVPQEYRSKVWRSCINMWVDHKKPRNHAKYYDDLVRSSQKQLNPSVKQIELDLLRTLPNNRHFDSLQSDGIGRLRRVLTAFSQRNRRVGYCQGMNRLAAVALLILTEEEAFWCLVAIIESIMPNDYYSHNLMSAHVDQYVLKDLLHEKLPTLAGHFERYDIELSLFSWFLTCFVDNIPVQVFLRIWDVFLYEGSKVLFRFALAFLKYHESNLLSLNDSMAINQYLRVFGERTTDVARLTHIAFVELNPFPMFKIKQKRTHYSQVVGAELRRLDELRMCVSGSDKSLDSQSD